MDEVTLSTILISDPFCFQIFKGTYPSNEILKQTYTFPACYVINTSTSHSPGQHWFVIYMEKNCKDQITAQIFDSLGDTYAATFLSEALKISLFGMTINRNVHRYQGPRSNACGLFCVYYIKLRCRGLSNKTVLNTLKPNEFARNERIIRQFVNMPQ